MYVAETYGVGQRTLCGEDLCQKALKGLPAAGAVFPSSKGRSVAALMPGQPCRGDGFATDPAFLKKDPTSSSAKPFFDAILDKPYLAQIVLAPHLYCPAVCTVC